MTVEIWIAIISALGAGGLGAAIVAAIAGRGKNQADVIAKLMEVSEKRIQAMCDRATGLESRVEMLEKQVSTLRSELSVKESTVASLQSENIELKAQIDELVKAGECKDRKITELQRRIRELEKQVNGLLNMSSRDVN
jgi:predicted RNase H-like nuclease (RuvC/YqgF family)